MAGEGGLANTKLLPARLTEGASEDHMIHRFLFVVATEQTTVVIPYIVVSMFEHVTCVQSVVHEKPAKNFDTHGASRAPEKRESWMGIGVSKKEPVVVGWLINRFTPGIVPYIVVRCRQVHVRGELLNVSHFVQGLWRER
mgnify:CR=1 FL=1